jgi:hypothetical protein
MQNTSKVSGKHVKKRHYQEKEGKHTVSQLMRACKIGIGLRGA